MSGTGSITTGGLAFNHPGIPNPADDFGYDPRTIARPSDPTEWPSAAATNWYYIDSSHASSTDSSNPNGYPDQPRNTIPEGSFAAGTVIVVGGSGQTYSIGGDGRWTMQMAGTQANPCFMIDEASSPTTINDEVRITNSSHFIFDGFRSVLEDQTPKINSQSGPSTYITFRNHLGEGPGNGNGSVFSMGGVNDANRTEYLVYYNNDISGFGDLSGSADYHAVLCGSYCSNIWILDSEHYQNAGDSVQVGSVGLSSTERPDHVYISGNDFHDERENAIDCKECSDVYVGNNQMYNFTSGSTSSGEAVIIHDNSENVWVFNNDIYNCHIGVISTAATNVYVVGNVIRDTLGTVDTGSPYFEPNTGVRMTGTSNCRVASNTFDNVQIGVQFTSSASGTLEVTSNIFANRQNAASGWDVMFENSTDGAGATVDNNLYEDLRNRISSTNYTSMSSWRSATPHDDNAVEGDPLYTNEGSNDFTLTASSPAVNAGAESAVFATYLADVGESIEEDKAGTVRPATSGDWDIGAYERA